MLDRYSIEATRPEGVPPAGTSTTPDIRRPSEQDEGRAGNLIIIMLWLYAVFLYDMFIVLLC